MERTEPEALRAFVKDPARWHVEGAERFEEYAGRFAQALTEIARAHAGGSVAVFTHGCVLSGGLHLLIGTPFDSSSSDNAAVCLLEYEQERFSPVYLFDNSHIPEGLSTRARQRWWRQQGGGFNLWYRAAGAEDEALYDPAFRPAPGDRIWIAMLEEEAVGYVAVSDTGLSCLWLKPAFRHRRMGDQLLGQAVVHLRQRGQKALRITVPWTNPEAAAFFAHHAAPEQTEGPDTVYRLEIHVPTEL